MFLYKRWLQPDGFLVIVNMRLASLLSLVPGFLAVYAQDLNIAAVEQAFNNANVSILLLLLHIPQF